MVAFSTRYHTGPRQVQGQQQMSPCCVVRVVRGEYHAIYALALCTPLLVVAEKRYSADI